jgi:hypothetical protein
LSPSIPGSTSCSDLPISAAGVLASREWLHS